MELRDDAGAVLSLGLTRRQILAAFTGLLLGILLGALDEFVVATALPTIVGELGGLSRLSWVVTAYLLAATPSIPLWGKLGDLYGRKRVYQLSLVVFLAGSALCGTAGSIGQLIAFRAFQGWAPAACSRCRWPSSATSSRRASAAATRATSRPCSRWPPSSGR
jgi:MFS family permease